MSRQTDLTARVDVHHVEGLLLAGRVTARVARVLQLPGPHGGSSHLTDTVSALVKGSVSAQIGRTGKQLRARAEGGAVELEGSGQE